MKHNILYSFRRCPYAIRARWALLNTNQLVELREVDLKNKPIELTEISKKAISMGLNGLMIETHNYPKKALSDANQQINSKELKKLIKTITINKI